MNNKTKIAFLKWTALFTLLAFIVAKVYDIVLHRPPLKYADVPPSTKEYLRNLGKNTQDQGISYSDQGPFDWNNNNDLGQKKSETWKSEEDENFIVYYHHDQEATWQAHAQDVLHHARENVGYLKDLFGVYFYAADMNGRRLAIYLPESESLYSSTIANLMEQPNVDSSGSLGITITQVGPLGCMTKGIVLHPSCFDVDPYDVNGFVKVLQHEMCHYVFFSALDYNRDVRHYLWVSEGIAEYFCDRHDHRQIHAPDSVDFIANNCQLTGEFPHEGNASYWAGESFFRFLEKKGKKAEVRKFIQDAFTHTTDSVFITQQQAPEKVHKQWVESLSNIAYQAPVDSVGEASMQ